MKIIRMLGIFILAVAAIKVGIIMLGLVSVLAVGLFWLALLGIIGFVIWRLLVGGPLKDSINITKMEGLTSQARHQWGELKKQLAVK